MDVFVLAVVINGWQIEVDDMHHVLDINTSSRNTSGDKNGRSTFLESTQCVLPLSLSSVGMNGSRRQTIVEEEVVNEVSSFLRANKNKSASGRAGNEQVVQRLLFLVLVDVNNLSVG